MSVPSCKPFKTFEEQAKKLISRNLIADQNDLIARLKEVNYYRLSGYLYPFRKTITDAYNNYSKSDHYRAGTTLDLVWSYYLFDRRLRLLLLDVIERIEVSLRTRIAYYWAKSTKVSNPQKLQTSYKPSFYKKTKSYESSQKDSLIDGFQKAYDRSIDDCMLHHKNKLGFLNVADIPIWVFIELSTIGELVKLFYGLKDNLKLQIAKEFGISDVGFFSSVLTLIQYARNACAHHARIWNHQWNQKNSHLIQQRSQYLCPIVKDTSMPIWNLKLTKGIWMQSHSYQTLSFSKISTAFLLTACNYLLQYSAHTSDWKQRLFSLLESESTPANVAVEMGFTHYWKDHPLWK